MTVAKFCPECGTPTQGAKFCPECGTPTAMGDAAAEPVAAEAESGAVFSHKSFGMRLDVYRNRVEVKSAGKPRITIVTRSITTVSASGFGHPHLEIVAAGEHYKFTIGRQAEAVRQAILSTL
jgi:hypothetical protein